MKLDELGYEYEGADYVRVPLSLISELQCTELEYGCFTKIDRNLLYKTALIEAAEAQYKKAVKEEC